MWRHCRHVGGQKQYIFSSLGNKIHFHTKLFRCFSTRPRTTSVVPLTLLASSSLRHLPRCVSGVCVFHGPGEASVLLIITVQRLEEKPYRRHSCSILWACFSWRLAFFCNSHVLHKFSAQKYRINTGIRADVRFLCIFSLVCNTKGRSLWSGYEPLLKGFSNIPAKDKAKKTSKSWTVQWNLKCDHSNELSMSVF